MSSGTGSIIYSDDLTSWTVANVFPNEYREGGNPLLEVNGEIWAIFPLYTCKSSNGKTWTKVSNNIPVPTAKYRGCAYGNGIYALVLWHRDVSGNTMGSTSLYISTDGVTWSSHSMPTANASDYAWGMRFNNGIFVLYHGQFTMDPNTFEVTSSSMIFYVSTDGKNWTSVPTLSSSSGNTYTFEKIIIDNCFTIRLGKDLYISPDCKNWTLYSSLPVVPSSYLGGALVSQ